MPLAKNMSFKVKGRWLVCVNIYLMAKKEAAELENFAYIVVLCLKKYMLISIYLDQAPTNQRKNYSQVTTSESMTQLRSLKCSFITKSPIDSQEITHKNITTTRVPALASPPCLIYCHPSKLYVTLNTLTVVKAKSSMTVTVFPSVSLDHFYYSPSHH